MRLSVTKIAHAVGAGNISASEAVDACIARIRAVNPRLNAVVLLDEEGARSAARIADAKRASGAALGLLHGVPFTVKDSIEVAGMRTTAGAPCWRDRISERDTGVVARLRAAGAILLGKTNLPAVSEGFETDNLLFGRTNHPDDPTRTPGGSSGGEAAIIAAGGSPLGVGADAAGSVRVPAHFCGLASIKPTTGRLPIDGHFPEASGSVVDRMQFAPMASTVDDVALAYQALATAGDGAESSQRPYRSLDDVEIPGLRVAYFVDNGIRAPTAATVNAVRRAARVLAEAGAVVTEVTPPGIAATAEIMPSLFYGTDGGQGFRDFLSQMGMTTLSPLLESSLERARSHAKSPAMREAVLAEWRAFRARFAQFAADHDLIVCPVAAGPAPLHGATTREDPMLFFSYCMTFNLCGWPAATACAGTSPEGLPIGVQLAAPPWREDVALAAARTVERALGPWRGAEGI